MAKRKKRSRNTAAAAAPAPVPARRFRLGLGLGVVALAAALAAGGAWLVAKRKTPPAPAAARMQMPAAPATCLGSAACAQCHLPEKFDNPEHHRHRQGRRAEAIRTLQAALAPHPYDREILFALAIYQRGAGDAAQARNHARLLLELEPENGDFARLALELGADAPDRPGIRK